MKKIIFYSFLVISIVVSGCLKDLEVDTPTLSIELDPAKLSGEAYRFKVGDTVSFHLRGSVGNLAFYPGTDGFNYKNRTRTLLDSVHPVLSFASKLEWGSQENTLKVLAANFIKSSDSAGVVQTDWVDITNRAKLATTATVVNSGNIDLSDVAGAATDKLYIAFVYSGITGSTQRTWTITNLVINNIFTDVVMPLTSLGLETNYWLRFGAIGGGTNWTANATQLQMVGGTSAAPSRTCWIVSRPLQVGAVANDKSIPVKNINDPDIIRYDYIYKVPGTYTAVWEAFNNTAKQEKRIQRTFTIEVLPR